MLQIRSEQVHTLGAPATATFVERLGAHLRRFFPERCASLDEEALELACQQVVTKGRGHGIVSERDLCKLANLVFTLGPDFDTDPDFPWARMALEGSRGSGPTLRINRLYIAAIRYLEARGAER